MKQQLRARLAAKLALAQEEDPDAVEYDTTLHVIAIFVLLVCSALGVGIPVLMKRQGLEKKPSAILLLLFAKMVGCGVIISTGFIHTLADSVESLDGKFGGDYDAYPYVIAIAAILVSAALDFGVARLGVQSSSSASLQSWRHSRSSAKLKTDKETSQTSNYRIEVGAQSESPKSIDKEKDDKATLMDTDHGHDHGHGHLGEEGCWTQATLFELGILSHSVLIGIDLGLQQDAKALMVALCFHQFFEGFALAQVMLESTSSHFKIIFAVIFFSLTTPAGVAIGVIIHHALGDDYDENAYEMASGVLSAIAGGILIYMGMSQLLTNWIVNNEALLRAPMTTVALAFTGLIIGLAIMSVIALWA